MSAGAACANRRVCPPGTLGETSGTTDLDGPERMQRIAREHEAACRAIREAKTEDEANVALLVALRLERLMTE